MLSLDARLCEPSCLGLLNHSPNYSGYNDNDVRASALSAPALCLSIFLLSLFRLGAHARVLASDDDYDDAAQLACTVKLNETQTSSTIAAHYTRHTTRTMSCARLICVCVFVGVFLRLSAFEPNTARNTFQLRREYS